MSGANRTGSNGATRPVAPCVSDVFGCEVVFDEMLCALVARACIEVFPRLVLAEELTRGAPRFLFKFKKETFGFQCVIDVIHIENIDMIE